MGGKGVGIGSEEIGEFFTSRNVIMKIFVASRSAARRGGGSRVIVVGIMQGNITISKILTVDERWRGRWVDAWLCTVRPACWVYGFVQ